eukprot:m51a1_g4113 hypothetical protein (152) ;mRNA; r:134784-135437
MKVRVGFVSNSSSSSYCVFFGDPSAAIAAADAGSAGPERRAGRRRAAASAGAQGQPRNANDARRLAVGLLARAARQGSFASVERRLWRIADSRARTYGYCGSSEDEDDGRDASLSQLIAEEQRRTPCRYRCNPRGRAVRELSESGASEARV